MLAVVLAAGTVAYSFIGLGLFDAFYQTTITVTTVGYGELGGVETDGTYRTVSLFVVLIGTGMTLYTAGVLVETLVEGTLNHHFTIRRMQRMIDEMNGHVVVAGWGRVGKAIVESIVAGGDDVVVIDCDPAEDESDYPVIVGEATDDAVLVAAGIERAAVFIAALGSDADNLYVTLSARALRPDLFIVVRTSTQENEPKFFRAGADRVLNPHEIGGSRMAALAMQPHVAEFLDEVLHDQSHDVELLEFRVVASSAAVGRTLEDLTGNAGRPDTATVIAVRHEHGQYRTNPPGDQKVIGGDVLIALGSRSELDRLQEQVT